MLVDVNAVQIPSFRFFSQSKSIKTILSMTLPKSTNFLVNPFMEDAYFFDAQAVFRVLTENLILVICISLPEICHKKD